MQIFSPQMLLDHVIALSYVSQIPSSWGLKLKTPGEFRRKFYFQINLLF